MYKKILVTGAGGYVGKYVLDGLLSNGFQVTCFIRKGVPFVYDRKDALRVVEGDITDKESLRPALKGVDAVIHLAAAQRIISFEVNYQVNFIGTRNLIELCTAYKIKRVIFTSSVAVLKNKRGPYGETKVMAEKLFTDSSLDYTIFRPTIIYGVHGVGITNVIDYVTKFPFFIPLVGHGRWTRQPVSVYDVAKALVLSVNNKQTYRKIYPLCGKDKIPFRDLVDVVAKAIGVKKIKISFPVWLCYYTAKVFERVLSKPPFTSENVRNLSQGTEMDITELVRDTNFNPIDIEQGIKNLIAELREKKLL
ncbi:NAD-dependent epimerase/dehydratase family protein [Candidatus Woesearchaeota archaeon]|nr:NAD-dependent epimerase/dehydratase family protein [Candidatus Woesearchaeota archaeon]